MEPHCLGRPTDPERNSRNDRLFSGTVLWTAQTGSPSRDLLERFIDLIAAYRRFRDWRGARVVKRIFNALTD